MKRKRGLGYSEPAGTRSRKDQPGRSLRRDAEAQSRLTDLEAAMKAIYRGEADGIAVDGPQGSRIFTLQNPEDPYRILAERMSEGVATLTVGGIILFCNRCLADMVKIPVERLLGASFVGVLLEPGEPEFLQLAHRTAREDVRREGGLRRSDGKIVPVLLSLSQVPIDETGPGICLVITNLSDQKRAQEELRLSQQRLSGIIQSAMDAIITVDDQQNVVLFNGAAEKMFGCLAEDAVGHALDQFIPQRYRVAHRQHIRKFAETGFVSRVMSARDELWAVRSGGEEFQIETSISQIETADRKLFTVILRDITERKRAEEILKQSRERQLRLKDELLSHVSHELRTPMACVHQFTTILLDGLSGPLTADQKEAMEIILKSANQLRSMIDDLLETARIEAGKVKIECTCVVLHDAVQEAVAMMQSAAASKAIQLQHKGDGGALTVYADPHRILQILLNLIGNALKFTPAGGLVEVSCGASPEDPSYAFVTVKDNGCGISEAAQARVFERLYQEENSIDHGRQGLGLGLAICKELVSRHTGKIWVNSQPGNGSAFSFTLPIYCLRKILSPVLVEDGAVRKAVSLITIRLTPYAAPPALELRNTIRRKWLDLLHRCTLPDKDVVLPPVGRAAAGEVFVVVAGTDARGAEILTRRIEHQMQRSLELSDYASAHITSRIVPAMREAELGASEDLAAMTDGISRAVSQALNEGVEADAQT